MDHYRVYIQLIHAGDPPTASNRDKECPRAGSSTPSRSDCNILQLAGWNKGRRPNDPHLDREDFAIALDMLPGNTAPGPDGVPVDHNDGMAMVFWQSTIIVNGFSMVFFLQVNHCYRWFFNGFSHFNHWYQWFFRCFFYKWTIAIEWMVCGSPLTSMVYQWFWEKLKLVHKKGQKTKKSMICSTNT